MLCVSSVRVLPDEIVVISPGVIDFHGVVLGENGNNTSKYRIHSDRLNNFFLSKTSHSSPHDCTKIRVVDRLSKVRIGTRLS